VSRQRDPLDDLSAAIRRILGRPSSAEERERFGKYLNLLLIWNRTHRLTGVRSASDVVHRLFIDSLLFLHLLPSARPLRIVDIGAGAGIPGVPLRIVEPRISMTLIEATRKKASFLEVLKYEVGIEDITIFHGRAETIVAQQVNLFEKFDVVVARAVSSPRLVFPLAAPYLRPGGEFIMSGPPRAKLVGSQIGLKNAEIREIKIPDLGVERMFLVVRKDT